jgi:hypothetical protein
MAGDAIAKWWIARANSLMSQSPDANERGWVRADGRHVRQNAQE